MSVEYRQWDEEDYKEQPEHQYMRPRSLRVIVDADTGVTLSEPDQYWTVFITDSVGNKLKDGRTVCESTHGDTSMKALMDCICECLDKWKKEFDAEDND